MPDGKVLNAAARKAQGLAIDIGTTTVAMYLTRLDTGGVISVSSALNWQKAFGGDVASRIRYAAENPEGAGVLQRLLLEQLNDMLRALDHDSISSVVIAANTAMTNFLLGVSATPSKPAVTELIITDNMRIPLHTGTLADITVMPAVSARIGGDIVSGILYTGLHKSGKLKMLIDLGSNVEIALGNKDRVCACAVAAGPVFDGGRLACGVGGIRGAVDTFRLVNGRPSYTTIGGEKAIGICGSGAVDMAAELAAAGIIDEAGLMPSSPYHITDRVYLTAGDVHEIQLAKAAVAAGIRCLLEHCGADASDVDEIYLSGGFGNYIHAESALRIKMLPAAFGDRIRGAGNSSAGGALTLLHGGDVNEVRAIRARTECLELSGYAPFHERLAGEMGF